MFTNLLSINSVSNHGFKFSISMLGPTLENAEEVYKRYIYKTFYIDVFLFNYCDSYFFRQFTFDNILDVAKIFIDS